MCCTCYGAPYAGKADHRTSAPKLSPEFVAHAIQERLKRALDQNVLYQLRLIADIESFHEKFRDECTRPEVFGSINEAYVINAKWQRERIGC
jgi:hypothetical protein